MLDLKQYINTVLNDIFPSKPINTYTTLCVFGYGKILHVEYSQFGDPVWFTLYLCDKNNNNGSSCEVCRSEIDFTPYTGQYVDVSIVQNNETQQKSLVVLLHIPEPLTDEDIELINCFY